MSTVIQTGKKYMLGLPNVSNTIWKVQGSPTVFSTIEKDKKIFHQSSTHIYLDFSDNDMSLLYWLTYLYIVYVYYDKGWNMIQE